MYSLLAAIYLRAALLPTTTGEKEARARPDTASQQGGSGGQFYYRERERDGDSSRFAKGLPRVAMETAAEADRQPADFD
jgi:hypothetical protein